MSSAPSDTSNNTEWVLVNIVEELVREKTLELIKTMDMCRCEKCYLNACAISLNSLKPLYVTTERGSLLSQISTINVHYQTDLTVEVVKALMTVKDAPRH